MISLRDYDRPKVPASRAGRSFSGLKVRLPHLGQASFSLKEKQTFFQLLGSLLGSGLSLLDSLDIMREQNRKTHIQELLDRLRSDLEAGKSFSDSLQAGKRVWGAFEIQHIRLGEETGRLPESLRRLGIFYEKRLALRRKLSQALSYPILVVLLAGGVLAFMLGNVVPMFADLFSRFDASLPPLTLAIMRASALFQAHFGSLLGAVGLLLLSLWRLSRKTKFRMLWGNLLLSVPLLGRFVQTYYLARLADAWSLLLAARLPLDQSLLLLPDLVGFAPLAGSLRNLHPTIMAGESLYEACRDAPVFSAYFLQILRVGEKTARLDEMLAQAAEKLEKESAAGLSQLTQMLEPVLILSLGLMVALILVAMYLPMFELGNAVG
jgi:type IV pilus assembly protein PilC